MKSPSSPRALNNRQQRFCELIASGVSGTEAWLQAGYKVSRVVAATNGAESLRKPHIAARVAELRKPQTGEIRKTRFEKLRRLEEIAWSEDVRTADVIAAIRAHNEMTGDNAPSKVEVETGPRTLDSIRERASRVASALDRNAQLRCHQEPTPTSRPVGLSRWGPVCPD